MPMKIVILEDNVERQRVMRDCLQGRFRHFEILFFDEAATVIEFLRNHLDETIAISLDHDLDMKTAADGALLDPGSGRAVADFLAQRMPVCPVVIHSSNGVAVLGMKTVLEEARWKTHIVAPCDDLEWISMQWSRTMRRAIVGPVKNSAPSTSRVTTG